MASPSSSRKDKNATYPFAILPEPVQNTKAVAERRMTKRSVGSKTSKWQDISERDSALENPISAVDTSQFDQSH